MNDVHCVDCQKPKQVPLTVAVIFGISACSRRLLTWVFRFGPQFWQARDPFTYYLGSPLTYLQPKGGKGQTQ